MEEAELIFNFFYILVCICIIYPPEEFISLGLTIENGFSRLLGSKDLDFIRYNQKRTALNLVVYSCLPAFYFLIHHLKFAVIEENNLEWTFKATTWKIAQRFSLLAVLFIPGLILHWSQNNWKYHPISRALMKFSNEAHSYEAVARDIGNEYMRQDVFKMKMNSITTVIATENWIIKTGSISVYFAHQSDTTLRVEKSETYNIARDMSDSLQIISIIVQPGRSGAKDFNIRINALEFRALQDRISRPITIPSGVQFHRNIMERFIEAFKDQVEQNPIYTAEQTTDKCFACMIAEPDIKIHKQCLDADRADGADRCTNCYCRPMWCVNCLARWFAVRQNEFERDVWLEKKCTCPMCRATFCLLDVSFINRMRTGSS